MEISDWLGEQQQRGDIPYRILNNVCAMGRFQWTHLNNNFDPDSLFPPLPPAPPLLPSPPPQVKVLELESLLENERLRLGELRKKHYDIAGVPLDQLSEGNGDRSVSPSPSTMSPKASKPALMKKPALAQKPTLAPKVVVRKCFRAACETGRVQEA